MKRKLDHDLPQHELVIFHKEKSAKLDDEQLMNLITHFKHELSDRVLQKLNSLPDEMMALILSFLDRFEIVSLGSLLFFKKWSRFVFHHDEYWKGFWKEIFPSGEIEYDFKLHNSYLLGRIRDFERFDKLEPVMASVDTGGGSDLRVDYFIQDKSFSDFVYYVEWPTEIPLCVSAYQGYNAQECEKFTSIPDRVIGVYYSKVNPTKFYFSMESSFDSRMGEDEYVDSTLLDIDWITPQQEKIEGIVHNSGVNLTSVEKLLKTGLLQPNTDPKEWSNDFMAFLEDKNWLSQFFKVNHYLNDSEDNVKDKVKDKGEESSSEEESDDESL